MMGKKLRVGAKFYFNKKNKRFWMTPAIAFPLDKALVHCGKYKHIIHDVHKKSLTMINFLKAEALQILLVPELVKRYGRVFSLNKMDGN